MKTRSVCLHGSYMQYLYCPYDAEVGGLRRKVSRRWLLDSQRFGVVSVPQKEEVRMMFHFLLTTCQCWLFKDFSTPWEKHSWRFPDQNLAAAAPASEHLGQPHQFLFNLPIWTRSTGHLDNTSFQNQLYTESCLLEKELFRSTFSTEVWQSLYLQ